MRYRKTTADSSGEESLFPTTGLTGYGVELALKRTDYLVVDDRATTQSPGSVAQKVFEAPGEVRKAAGMFGDVLGDNTWAQLAKPLRLSELEGKRTWRAVEET